MSMQRQIGTRWRVVACACALLGAGTASVARAAGVRSVDEHRPADPHGQVEITNVSGRIEVEGWDKPEVEVSGTLGPDVERLDIDSSGSRTSVRVVPSDSRHWGIRLHESGDAMLTVHVPQGSDLSASLVNSDIRVHDLQGDQELQTVSGEVKSVAARDVRVHTVSGDVHLSAGRDSGQVEIGTVSGDIDLDGGQGEISINTVSGSSKLVLGTLTRAHFKSVSGDYEIVAGLTPDGHIEAESVSGDFQIDFVDKLPPAEFDLQSFSGDLKTCFGQKGEHERHGPGSRLSYREGAGTARVRIDTNSGDVTLCSKRVSGADSREPDALTRLLQQGLEFAGVKSSAPRYRPVLSRPANCRACVIVES